MYITGGVIYSDINFDMFFSDETYGSTVFNAFWDIKNHTETLHKLGPLFEKRPNILLKPKKKNGI